MEVKPKHQTPWDWRAAVQFICGGTGTGLLFFTALAAWEEPIWLWRTGLLAMIFIGVGLFSVWMKLGRRWRALFVFLNPRTSWMSREALLSIPLGLLGLVAVGLQIPTLALIAAVFGLGFLYAQARILRAAAGIPAWREPLIVPLISFTGLTEGAALFVAAALLFGAVETWFVIVLFLLIAVRLLVWLAYRRKLSAPGSAPIETVKALEHINDNLLVLGHVIPLLVVLAAIFFPGNTAVTLATLIAALLTLLGGWYLKATLITRAAYDQGFAIEHAPARTPGYAGPGAKPGWS